MHLIVNALSSTNLSGRQVLCGHVLQWCRRAPAADRMTLLLHDGNMDVQALLQEEGDGPLPASLQIFRAPAFTAHWLGRSLYEHLRLGGLVRRLRADAYVSMSGGYVPRIPCPQYTLALNPWALVDTGPRPWRDALRARLQRRAYRQAVRRADGIGYGSRYMQGLYRANAGARERKGAIVYPALSIREAAALDAEAARHRPRDRHTILCVSLMARHKDIGALCQVLRILRTRYDLPARLWLAGGWADPSYRNEIERAIGRLGLNAAVEITGHLSRSALRTAYTEARVYMLLSRSESFGIPAIEAQRVGTPVIAARCSAAPEVCGDGARYVDPGDAESAARLCAELMTDDAAWTALSKAARANAQRFDYERTSRPLLAMMGVGVSASA